MHPLLIFGAAALVALVVLALRANRDRELAAREVTDASRSLHVPGARELAAAYRAANAVRPSLCGLIDVDGTCWRERPCPRHGSDPALLPGQAWPRMPAPAAPPAHVHAWRWSQVELRALNEVEDVVHAVCNGCGALQSLAGAGRTWRPHGAQVIAAPLPADVVALAATAWEHAMVQTYRRHLAIAGPAQQELLQHRAELARFHALPQVKPNETPTQAVRRLAAELARRPNQ